MFGFIFVLAKTKINRQLGFCISNQKINFWWVVINEKCYQTRLSIEHLCLKMPICVFCKQGMLLNEI